jgi:hypothetical protein
LVVADCVSEQFSERLFQSVPLESNPAYFLSQWLKLSFLLTSPLLGSVEFRNCTLFRENAHG